MAVAVFVELLHERLAVERALALGSTRESVLRRGTFRLASGREASFYLDAKQVVLDARGAMLVGRAILERLRGLLATYLEEFR